MGGTCCNQGASQQLEAQQPPRTLPNPYSKYNKNPQQLSNRSAINNPQNNRIFNKSSPHLSNNPAYPISYGNNSILFNAYPNQSNMQQIDKTQLPKQIKVMQTIKLSSQGTLETSTQIMQSAPLPPPLKYYRPFQEILEKDQQANKDSVYNDDQSEQRSQRSLNFTKDKPKTLKKQYIPKNKASKQKKIQSQNKNSAQTLNSSRASQNSQKRQQI